MTGCWQSGFVSHNEFQQAVLIVDLLSEDLLLLLTMPFSAGVLSYGTRGPQQPCQLCRFARVLVARFHQLIWGILMESSLVFPIIEYCAIHFDRR
jgi:hypothetical protein